MLSADPRSRRRFYDVSVRHLIRAIWEEPGAPDPPRRNWRDWALVGVFAPTAVLEAALRPDVPWRFASLAIALGLIPTLLWRRSRPLAMVVVAFGALLLTDLWGLLARSDPPALNTMACLMLLPYALGRWGSGRQTLIGLPVMLLTATLATLAAPTGLGDAIGGYAVLFFVMALGAAVRYRVNARSRELEQAKLLEREQLARDLHDTVAHHVSAIVIRAQAGLAVAADSPAAAGEALRVIEAEAARTLAEMRGIVRALRRAEEAAELAPAPLVADLRGLDRPGGTGPRVEVELAGDVLDVAPAVSTALYRMAQESVTNARRHARGASRIAVSVMAGGPSVRLRVSDDGERVPPPPAGGAPGFGVLGMAERAALLGGSLVAGPEPDRGWTVSAVLPRHGPAS